jgi:hypothetical protein
MDPNARRLSAANEQEFNPYAAPAPAQDAPLHPVVVSADDEPSDAVFDELKRVANYRQICKTLRASGTGSIVFGVIAIAVGVATIRINPNNTILLVIGILLTVEGLWLVISPTPIGIIIDGVSLMLVGSWNVFISIMNMAIRAGTGAWPVVGIFQFIWGLQSFGRYSRFSQMPREIPGASTIKRIDQIAKDILRTKPAQEPQVIFLLAVNNVRYACAAIMPSSSGLPERISSSLARARWISPRTVAKPARCSKWPSRSATEI